MSRRRLISPEFCGMHILSANNFTDSVEVLIAGVAEAYSKLLLISRHSLKSYESKVIIVFTL
jgi:hypothetical protein